MIDRAPGLEISRTTPASMNCSVLVLNRMYMAVHVVGVRRAFCLLCKQGAEVINIEDGAWMTYDFSSWLENCNTRAELGQINEIDDWIQSVNFSIQVPRVIRLLDYDRVPKNSVKFSRRNVFLRDEYHCQYCAKRFGTGNLSLDHVMPRSQGGQSSWVNIVTACLKCNVRKGGRTPEQANMRLLNRPVQPKNNPILSQQLKDERYQSWRNFVAVGKSKQPQPATPTTSPSD